MESEDKMKRLAELSEIYDSVNSLYVRSITEVERFEGQSQQKTYC